MLTSQELSALLRNHGYKVTPQRLAVYEALAEQPWHPNAEMLYSKLQPKYPAMSFATVYKTVEILRDIKAIQILKNNNVYYDDNPYLKYLMEQDVVDELLIKVGAPTFAAKNVDIFRMYP